MLIAFCVGLVIVLFLGGVFIVINRKYRQSAIEQKRTQQEFLETQDERLASCLGKANQIQFDIELNNRQWLEEEKREIFAQIGYMSESIAKVTDNLADEIHEINQRIDREIEAMNQEKVNQIAFVEEYSKDFQNFRDDIVQQMEIVAKRSQPLSKQLEDITMKLTTINELKQELAEFGQPIQTDIIKKWHSEKAV